MRILVTGANGFVGAHLVRYFSSLNLHVISAAGKSTLHDFDLSHFGEVAHVDFRNSQSIHDLTKYDPDCIIHCAALSTPAQCWEDKALTEQVNVKGVEDLLRAFPDKKIVFTSTDLVFEGGSAPKDGFKEGDTPFPVSTYAKSKVTAESRVLRHPHAVVCRLALVYGPPILSFGGALGWLREAIVSHKRVSLFHDEFRTPVYVADIARAFEKFFERWPSSQRLFHFAGPDRISRYDFGIKYLRQIELNTDLVDRKSQKDFLATEPRGPDVSLSAGLFSGKYAFSFTGIEAGLKLIAEGSCFA